MKYPPPRGLESRGTPTLWSLILHVRNKLCGTRCPWGSIWETFPGHPHAPGTAKIPGLKRGWPDRCLPLTACERRCKRSPKPAGRREVGWKGDQDKLLQWGKEETPVQWGDFAGRSSDEQSCTPTATGRNKDPEELMCSVSFSSGVGKLSLQRAG